MSNNNDKKLKRKKKLELRKKNELSKESYFYEGKKYKVDEYIPTFHTIETWLCNAVIILKRVDIELKDSDFGKLFVQCIKRINKDGLSTQVVESKIRESKEEYLLDMSNIFYKIVSTTCERNLIPQKDMIGILKTLNSSRITWGEINNSDRGYIEMIMENIGADLSALTQGDDTKSIEQNLQSL